MYIFLTLILFLLFIAQAIGNGAVTFYRTGSLPSHSLSSGILRVYYNGVWGNVCHGSTTDGGYSWGQNESDVVCRQMGWSGAMEYNPTQIQTRLVTCVSHV